MVRGIQEFATEHKYHCHSNNVRITVLQFDIVFDYFSTIQSMSINKICILFYCLHRHKLTRIIFQFTHVLHSYVHQPLAWLSQWEEGVWDKATLPCM